MRVPLKNKFNYIIGIDEVGRGPIAGPVTLCAFLLPLQPEESYRSLMKHFRGVKDSKQLSATEREAWYRKIQSLKMLKKKLKKNSKNAPSVEYALSSVSSEKIDQFGLSWAIKRALADCLKKLNKPPHQCLVLLDGSLKAPIEYLYQKTIIRGDEKEPLIALASIVAKVTRDRRLTHLAKKYPLYGFNIHKGYGTAGHYEKIVAHGVCSIHRRSFLKELLK